MKQMHNVLLDSLSNEFVFKIRRYIYLGNVKLPHVLLTGVFAFNDRNVMDEARNPSMHCVDWVTSQAKTVSKQ